MSCSQSGYGSNCSVHLGDMNCIGFQVLDEKFSPYLFRFAQFMLRIGLVSVSEYGHLFEAFISALHWILVVLSVLTRVVRIGF